MIGEISGYNPYSTYGLYGASYANRSAQTKGASQARSAAQAQNADRAQTAQRSGVMVSAQKVHQPDTPVQPVTPTRPISSNEDPAQAGLLRFGSDPAEMAVRMRIQYPGDSAQQSNAAQAAGAEKAETPELTGLKGAGAEKGNTPEPAGLKGADGEKAVNPALKDSKSAQEVMEEGECQTCKERKYQDGSDDPGVSFKTPTNISPEQAAAAVRGHENEHVVREQAKAQREDRKVVSQSVTYHTSICPECGKAYVSGGTTETVTKANTDQQAQQQNQQNQQGQQNPAKPFAAIA